MTPRELAWTIYIRGDKVFIPTIAKTQAGYYLEVEPVSVVLSKDRNTVARALVLAIERGNPIVATPSRVNFPEPVVLRHAGVRNWSTFVNNTRNVGVEKRNGSYVIVPYHKDGNGWVGDYENVTIVPSTGTLEQISEQLIDRILST